MKTRHRIVEGNALDMSFIEDGSVDLIVTSPPYFGQRMYFDKDGNSIVEAVGSEATPAEYLDALDRFMDEAWRVLKPTGSVFVNLGDKYAGSGGHNNANIQGKEYDPETPTRDAPTRYTQSTYVGPNPNMKQGARDGNRRSRPFAVEGVRRKSLMGLPWRFAIRQIDNGWVLRAEMVWDKPNGMPESVTDRVRRGHEQWFHFTKEEKYYAAIDELREPHEGESRKQSVRAKQIAKEKGLTDKHLEAARAVGLSDVGSAKATQSGSGKNSEETQRLADEAKKALGGYFREFLGADTAKLGKSPASVQKVSTGGIRPTKTERETFNLPDHFAPFPAEWPRFFILGWCPEGGTVLDPFAGTGTTALVASILDRNSISIDLSPAYVHLMKWRLFISDHKAKITKKWKKKGLL